jgi:hypothetical protein
MELTPTIWQKRNPVIETVTHEEKEETEDAVQKLITAATIV